ncbi:MAG: Nif11-like leader peptide family RiPP precursor [Microcystis sp. M54BS1]|jgi:predicted ribosomally synthesized peptide with nif11-like leader|uniref:Nif11-like leader peptide family RiPP precursor n=1 Tax=unclassified Microcystis TaxID=2643300 RepID=UPI001D974ED3|nr:MULTISPECIES: Nif11-like leader peptide family RiPP precursor [unclassified Microcystis]MCA2540920.1 Nif11-like leader peptide family RiPP precursor [Microcystis sp. M54BS1]MCA2596337.1 Nif11-like leader peptide family RiPP precursor [Microcystis sp. M38BS1]MCA2612493.1 Nif11-like leader peptide family RiPP precursor [Microcystis sp. M27BS1]NCS28121.1 Nif11-like leader peptide family natural product precursor [Microcystis aeruginosa F13-15]MCA2508102.1 Nif11-like leader peptide family RiPP 
MSQPDVERFYEIARNSEELQAMLGAAEDRDSFVETAVRLGQENGCNFTLDEANEFLNTKKGDVELSEQELEAVAGGRGRLCNNTLIICGRTNANANVI